MTAVRLPEPRRRNRLSRNDAVAVAVIAVTVGVLASVWRDAAPTSVPIVNDLFIALFVGVVAWAGASCPWWALALAAIPPTLLSVSALGTALAVVALVIGLYAGVTGRSVGPLRALGAGAISLALLELGPSRPFGASAAIAGALAGVIVVLGVRRRDRFVRRRARRFGVWSAAALVVLAAAAVIGMLRARSDIEAGEQITRSAITALQGGEVAEASASLADGRAALERADRTLSRPWMKAALVVPVVGQHLEAVTRSVDGGLQLASTAESAVGQVDLDSLRIDSGAIDLNALEVLAGPFADVHAGLSRARGELAAADSGWLIAPLASRLASVTETVDDLGRAAARAEGALEVAPSLLGATEARTYFVAFTTPAEARGLGGFMGSWAELRADRGRISVVRTGTTSELTSAMRSARPTLRGLDEYVTRYGRFGAGDGEPVAIDYWSNVTMSPHFPSVAEVIAQLYPASGGHELDGVIAMDVFALSELVEFTGPITLTAADVAVTVTPDSALDWLLRGQYADVADDTARDELLGQLTEALITGVFDGALPGPRVLGSALGPAMAGGRLVIWSSRSVEEAALGALGLSGGLPRPIGDGLAVVTNNAGANKLDAYLRRAVSYDVVFDEDSGDLRGTVRVTLRNDAPTDLPADTGGNPFGLPLGTNRTYFSLYTPFELAAARVDDAERGMEVDEEQGWNVYSTYVDVPPGGAVELVLDVAGVLVDPDAYVLALRSQPLGDDDLTRLDVTTTGGRVVLAFAGRTFGVQTLS